MELDTQFPGRPRSGVYLKCETCGKEFYVNSARMRQVKKQGNTVRFCSMKCYKKDGKNNPFWGKKHTKKTLKLLSENPKRSRFKKGKENPNFIRFAENNFIGWSVGWWGNYLKTKVGKCENCGYCKYSKILEVHHKDRNRNNNTRENLILLCPNCHQEFHLLERSGRYLNKHKNEEKKENND